MCSRGSALTPGPRVRHHAHHSVTRGYAWVSKADDGARNLETQMRLLTTMAPASTPAEVANDVICYRVHQSVERPRELSSRRAV